MAFPVAARIEAVRAPLSGQWQDPEFPAARLVDKGEEAAIRGNVHWRFAGSRVPEEFGAARSTCYLPAKRRLTGESAGLHHGAAVGKVCGEAGIAVEERRFAAHHIQLQDFRDHGLRILVVE